MLLFSALAVSLSLYFSSAANVPFCTPDNSFNSSLSTCSRSSSQFHIICNNLPYFRAEEACESFGWRLAVPSSANLQEIMKLFNNCSDAPYLWVHPSDHERCMLFRPPGVVIGGLAECDFLRTAPILCQDLAVVTATRTITTTRTIRSGTVTTKTPRPTPSHERSDSEKLVPIICPYEIDDYHLVFAGVSAYDAAMKCSEYGFRLANLTQSAMGAAEALIYRCARSIDVAWIDSFLDSPVDALCVAFMREWTISYKFVVGYFLDGKLCKSTEGYPLCRDDLMAPTATTVYSMATTTRTTVVPMSTRTVNV